MLLVLLVVVPSFVWTFWLFRWQHCVEVSCAVLPYPAGSSQRPAACLLLPTHILNLHFPAHSNPQPHLSGFEISLDSIQLPGCPLHAADLASSRLHQHQWWQQRQPQFRGKHCHWQQQCMPMLARFDSIAVRAMQ